MSRSRSRQEQEDEDLVQALIQSIPEPRPSRTVQTPMSSSSFRKYGYDIIDWAIEYMTELPKRQPTSNVKPGFLRKVVPKDPPMHPDTFDNIWGDLEEVAVHGMAHWQHPQFFAYFAAGNSWPSIMGDILSNATASNGINWHECPAMTELEYIVMDWCCKFLGLPRFFLSQFSDPRSEGQGVLQCSASEAIFYSLIWAREDCLRKLTKKYPDKGKAQLLNMMVAYYNTECHCCVERGGMMGCVRMRKLPTDELGVVRSYTLRVAIEKDIEQGLVPFFHCAIIGSTGITCADDLMEVGPLCRKYDLWLHVDAAYAGSAFVCPEFSHLKQGFEYVWSTNINTNKWMLTNFEASLHWVRYKSKVIDAFGGGSKFIRQYINGVGPDLKHYGVSGSRRFRCLKLFFVIRRYGVEGIRRYIRNHVNLAKLFEMYVRRDYRFEVVGGPFKFGLVAFRLLTVNNLTTRLLDALNASHKIHLVSSNFKDKVVIRFALCSEFASERDVDRAWRTIDEYASVLLRDHERKLRGDRMLKYLYMQQHEHDVMRGMFRDPEIEKEEEEARQIFSRLDRDSDDDLTVIGAEDTARDGVWGDLRDEDEEAHDQNYRAHPAHLGVEQRFEAVINFQEAGDPTPMLRSINIGIETNPSRQEISRRAYRRRSSRAPPGRHY